MSKDGREEMRRNFKRKEKREREKVRIEQRKMKGGVLSSGVRGEIRKKNI